MDTVCRVSSTSGNMIIRAIVRLVIDDSGQDLVEYALLSGIVSVTGILVFTAVKADMGAAYTSWQSGAQAAWEPCAPITAGGCP